MKKYILSFWLISLVCLLMGCQGSTRGVKEELGASTVFSKTELQAAMDVVKQEFKGYSNCKLTDLWYEEPASNKEKERYFAQEDETENQVKPANQLVLYSHFKTGRSAANLTFNDHSVYSDWMWILAREDQDAPWKIVDRGY